MPDQKLIFRKYFMKKISNNLVFILFIVNCLCNYGQEIDHWETIIYSSDEMSYFPGVSSPGDNWYTVDFVDTTWQKGIGGFGYGDEDDNTVLPKVPSVFIRKKFTIIDLAAIERAIFHIDYDDGFVAWINGIEIARAGLSSTYPAYNEYAESHEAQMYNGGSPSSHILKKDFIQSTFIQGENLLAVQVNNSSGISSDLSAIVFLSAAITDTSHHYKNTPEWFIEPSEFTSSNLPVFIINTFGKTIQDENRIKAEMKVIYGGDGKRNLVSDTNYHYAGYISVELKGNSSKMFPKKSYRFETWDEYDNDTNISLLGFPKESDWILHAPYTDKTFGKNVLTYHLSRKMGNYASRTKYCEVILNDEYQGIYALMEVIKRDKNRVNISKLTETDIAGDNVSGGYIFKTDWNESHTWYTNYGGQYEFVYPKPHKILLPQMTYLQGHINTFEKIMSRKDISDSAYGYPAFINIKSFIDFVIITELSKQQDSYFLSAYYFKEKDSKGGKIYAGPMWDFNLSYGNTHYRECSLPEGWNIETYSQNGKFFNETGSAKMHFWWLKLWEDQNFQDSLNLRWWNLRENLITTEYINSFFDSTSNLLNEASIRNFDRFPIIGKYVWPNSYIGNTWEEEINYTKDWIADRIEWMDKEIGPRIPTHLSQNYSIKNTSVDLTSYPNPFHSVINLKFSIHERSFVKLEIIDFQGRIIKQLMNKELTSGIYSYTWNGTDFNNHKVSEGLYLCRIRTGSSIMTNKLIFIH